MNNPFFTDYNMPYDAVPFSKFKTEDFIPAIKKSIELTMERINKIVENNEEPNFENTILALETSEEELNYKSAFAKRCLQDIGADFVVESVADIILLDNMAVEMMRRAVDLCEGKVITEASGGINLTSVKAIAETVWDDDTKTAYKAFRETSDR